MPILPLLLAAAASPFTIYPNVTVNYYDVSGTDAAAILASIEAKRPHDPTSGKPYEAMTQVAINWKWKGAPKGGCDLKSTVMNFSATVIMPRLTSFDMLTPDLQGQWSTYIAALSAHEIGHLRIATDYMAKAKVAITRASCKTANVAGRAVLRQMNARDTAYDVETRHGAATGADFAKIFPSAASAAVKP